MTPSPPPTSGPVWTSSFDYQRTTLLDKTGDLSAGSIRQRIPTSALTLAGLLKHLVLVEDDWIQVRFLGRHEREPWVSAPWEQDRDWEFHTAEHEDPDELRALYRAACDRSRQAVTTVELDDLSVDISRDGTGGVCVGF